MMDIVITDLTRFNRPDVVCIAGINPLTNECVRPMPYLTTKECQRLNILPGAIMRGTFKPIPSANPHSEDRIYSGPLTFVGPCSSEVFEKVLEATQTDSVEEGFGPVFDDKQKYIPKEKAPGISIITLRVAPTNLTIVADDYNEGRIRAIFTDGAGKAFRYLPINDLGFYNYALKKSDAGRVGDLSDFIRAQERVFIRLGLSREYEAPDGRRGFWLQVNGIYTFPHYFEGIRCHQR